MPWFCSLLNLDHSGHVRMQRTKILVIACRRESERETIVGIQRFRPELSRGDDRVRDVIAIFPGHGGADLHRELGRLKGEIVDMHLGLFGERVRAAEKQGYCRGDGQSAKAAKRY